ncbi:hypothetical protein [Natrinema halophilum]|uniref:Formylmethanofuran dehydrogenase subunit E domain-containing protein n=1 Tax=Natrinema halophilum TaxID=1699371 RepID=A0A7D5KBA3_9EURY|nr:hypothetical protein [Natrinema halophilum]QLG47601.1 hypothetical protein HYG82_01425 [Natrinema halophilum]
MSSDSNSNVARTNESHWAVHYDIEPIRIRDPVAEALAVLEEGEPFLVDYEDIVTVAGHSCPTAAGAYRIAEKGLEALYPDSLPVRSEIEVLAAGPRDDPGYGITGRLISVVTGTAGVDGFGGLAGGLGDRQGLLSFDAFETDAIGPTFRFRRTDTERGVEVTYHVGDVPDGGPAIGNLRAILEGTATDDQRNAFADAWHDRVRAVLADDDLFSVVPIAPR